MLILPIKKQWFEMIANGEKKDEYREIKPYWSKRFWNIGLSIWDPDAIAIVIFRNGYGKNAPEIKARVNWRKGTGKKEWGANEDEEYYILEILEIIEIRNWDIPNPNSKQAMAVATLPATKPITATEEIQSEIVKAINKQFSIGIDIGEGISKTGQSIKNVIRGGIY